MKNILRALRYIPNYRRKVAGALVVGIIGAIIVTALPLAIQRVIDNLFKSLSGNEIAASVFLLPFGIWLVLRLLLMCNDWLKEIVEDNLFVSATIDFRRSVMTKLESLSINYFEKNRSGQIISEVNQSPFKLGDWLSSVVDNYIPTILNALFAIAVLTYKFPPVALVVLLIAVLYSWVIFKTTQKNRVFSKRGRKQANEFFGIASENISFIGHIRALAVEKSRSKLLSGKLNELNNNMREANSFQHRRNFLAAVVDLFMYAVPIAVFAYRAVNGQQQATDIYLLAVYIGTISQASARLSRMWSNTADTNDTVGETLAILDNADSVKEPKAPVGIESLGDITLSEVAFAYGGTSSDAIKSLDLEVKAGETVALVGRSGSGKSTLIKLLLRFYDPQIGSITVNGLDLREVAQEDLRTRYGVVMQDVALFNDTVAANIAIAKPKASKEEIIKAAKLAHAHEFISALPDGYDTLVGERGVKLSGGEKQRVSIARAVLRDPEVVLLDEATSALDSESEQYVQKGLKKLLKGRTAIIIAHRLSTIAHADKIVVMDKGKIVEQGTFEELKKQKGTFADLLARQQL